MNKSQELWWLQAKSDHMVLESLRHRGAAPCHQLHYLQMVTEKLGKAYLWRSGTAPHLSHASFVQFLRFLGAVPRAERKLVAEAFSFARFVDFRNWVRVALPMAYDLERLAPALANDGPNTEYPWPQENPVYAPVNYEFPLWDQLTKTARGRQMMQVVQVAIETFPTYAS